MDLALFLAGVVTLFLGAAGFFLAKTSVHEIAALLAVVIGALFVVGGLVMLQIERVIAELRKRKE